MSNFELNRADDGSGGWSLHAPDGELLISGPASWDDQSGQWDRPNRADFGLARLVGQRVHHAELGDGTVLSIDAEEMVARVSFSDGHILCAVSTLVAL